MTLTEIVKNAQSVLIIGHQRPDGDCIGAGLALKNVCVAHGKPCDFVFDSPAPAHFSFLPAFDTLNVFSAKQYDTVICVDCADHLRVGKYIGYVKNAKTSVNIDHHQTNNRFADVNVVVPDASSTCEVLFDLLEPAGELCDAVAYYLFVGLSTDTGHFMHSNTTAKVFRTAAKLAEYQIDPHAIAGNIYKNTTVGKTKLIARAITSMRFFADGKVCVISVRPDDLQACDCVLADTEGLIDYGMMIGSVEVAICLTEQNNPQFKVSFRSKGTDVAAAAAVFGGGGHKLAAG
ncbi:MAG: DHH family phosphoesterase [Clostridiales bacterium]|nr:DHH family phosphoesterase [Clostridiales bacterium]